MRQVNKLNIIGLWILKVLYGKQKTMVLFVKKHNGIYIKRCYEKRKVYFDNFEKKKNAL